jgi:orotidine-5'-phosphate decarboxylase
MRLAELSLEAGADGLVCSPREVAEVRARFGRRAEGGPFLAVPGIRGPAEATGGQKRTLSARATWEAGADLLVVGRPVTASADRAGSVRRLIADLGA